MKATVIFTVGFPGSGKSTVAKSVAKHFNATYLDKDSLCNTLTGAMLESHGELATARDNSELYRTRIMPAEYETLFSAAHNTLSSTSCVVIDAPFIAFLDDENYMNNQREHWQWQDVNVLVVEVFASLDITKQRLMSRGEARDHWKLENWQQFSTLLTTKTCRWENVHKIRFDNSATHASTAPLFQYIESLTQ